MSKAKPKTKRGGFLEAGQMAVFWRILHLMVSRHGNQPMGQTLVVLTMVYLNDRGMPPTMTELCDATGLPKASVSRYVSTQISNGLVREKVDPNDRRRRMLVQTKKGRAEWLWQVDQMEKIFREVEDQMQRFERGLDPRGAEELLARMTERTREAKGRT
jgi:DNA-binding MarR family transcriptional regulator